MRDVTGPSGALPQPAVRGASDIRHGTYIRWHHAACSNYVGVPGKYQARHYAIDFLKQPRVFVCPESGVHTARIAQGIEKGNKRPSESAHAGFQGV
ncbi:hypothetical protein CC2G_000336 [Coprinopsis cinerea AmutBmut pab1-1]|nr:hypothetical protein CC2G_000336 [Coprinopsis cinerea AmutBmut pab1-1]